MKVLLLALICGTVVTLSAADISTTLAADPALGRTRYTYQVTGTTQGSELHLHLGIETAFASPMVGSTLTRHAPITNECPDPCYTGTPTAEHPALTLVLDAKTSDVVSASVAWTITGQGSGTVVGPTSAYDSDFFSVMVGAGTLLTSRSAIDYELLQSNNTLADTGIGRNHVDLLLGGSFNMGFHKRGLKPLSAFISLKFTPGSTDTINGFVFGGGYRLTKYLDVIAGVGLTPHHEPAIGLRRVAFNIVTQNPNDPLYTGFVPTDLLLNRGQAPFDGFPLQRNGQAIYPGNPLELHYRAGFFVGVAFPLKLRSFFSNP